MWLDEGASGVWCFDLQSAVVGVPACIGQLETVVNDRLVVQQFSTCGAHLAFKRCTNSCRLCIPINQFPP